MRKKSSVEGQTNTAAKKGAIAVRSKPAAAVATPAGKALSPPGRRTLAAPAGGHRPRSGRGAKRRREGGRTRTDIGYHHRNGRRQEGGQKAPITADPGFDVSDGEDNIKDSRQTREDAMLSEAHRQINVRDMYYVSTC